MMCMIKFKMIFQSALITSLCLLLCACRADDPETVTPEYAAQSEEPDMLPEETAKKPEQVLLEQLVDDTHDAFLVDTGGELGTLLVTAELMRKPRQRIAAPPYSLLFGTRTPWTNLFKP